VLENIADLVVRRGAAPAAAVAVACRREGRWRVASAVAAPRGVPHRDGDPALAPIFDLASVTKPFVAVTAARLARRGTLELDAPLARLVPEVAGTPSAEVPLLSFLAHRAGLEAHRTLFAPLIAGRPVERAAFVAEAAAARRAECGAAAPPGGFAPLYSDLGYLLAGVALERVSLTPLDELVEREVCETRSSATPASRYPRSL